MELIDCPETSVTNHLYVISQEREKLIYPAAEA
jgi:hypothetical protein